MSGMQIKTTQLDRLDQAVHERQRAEEPERLRAQLRTLYPSVLAQVGDATMLAELRQALQCCDALGLTEPEDRRMFCHWDQALFPGMRELPQWPQWIAHCRKAMGPEDRSVLLRMLLQSPPAWWQRQAAQHREARAARGMPGFDLDALALAAMEPTR
jgi:hypothetical protein